MRERVGVGVGRAHRLTHLRVVVSARGPPRMALPLSLPLALLLGVCVLLRVLVALVLLVLLRRRIGVDIPVRIS